MPQPPDPYQQRARTGAVLPACDPGHRRRRDRAGVGVGYPRPPRVEPVAARVRVEFEGLVLADTTRALRVCETSSPPAYDIPQADILMAQLSRRAEELLRVEGARRRTGRCGSAAAGEGRGLELSEPDPGFESIRDCLSFYPRRMDACWVGEQRVSAQQVGSCSGGCVTPELVGHLGSPDGELVAPALSCRGRGGLEPRSAPSGRRASAGAADLVACSLAVRAP